MKKNEKKDLLTKQPVLKNVSLFGATMMISSSVLIPGMTTKAYADAAKDSTTESSEKVTQESELKETSQAEAMTINKIESLDKVTEEANQLDLEMTLNALRTDNLETTIKISPNVSLVWDETKNQIKDETGNVVGTYTMDSTLNQVKLTFSKGGFTQAKLVVPVTFKKFDLTEQIVTSSIGQSMISKHVLTERKIEEVTETTQEEVTESTSKETDSTKESTTETSKEIETTSSEKETSESTTESSSKETETTKEETKPSTTETSSSTSESTSTSTTTSIEESKETTETKTSESSSTTETSSTTESTSETESKEKEVKKEEPKAEKEQPAMARAAAPMMNGPVEPIAPPKPASFTTRAATPQAQFIEDTAYHAQQVAGANDLYASVMIAQAILESGYGSSTLSSPPNHNLFGVKGSYNGQSVNMQTWEHFDGQNVIINAQFRKYPSYRESFEDNARVLKTTSFYPGVYFYSGAWKSRTNSYRDATQWLTGRYATDPNYNNKLNNLIVTHNLTQYDSPGSGNGGNNSGSNNNNGNNNNSNNNSNNNTNNASTHTVKSGDTLYGISMQYGVSVAQIKSWNNLSSDTIYVGQKLKVKNGGGGTTNPPKPVTPTKPTDNNNNTNNASTYTVKSGDTLYGIALKHNVSVAQIKSWNNLSSDTIYVGQKLKVKNGGGSTTNPPKPVTPTKPTDNGNTNNSASTYTVRSGDTLYGIALKHNVSVAQIKSWNNLTSDTIYVGQKLKVKNGGGNTTNPPKPTTPTNNNNNNSSNTKTHTVKRGDTLYGISLQYGVSVAQIKSWNNLSSDTIYVGQKLNVNSQKSTTTNNNNNNNKPKPTTPTGSKTHTVQRGDTLYGIGLRYGVSSNDIKKWNNLTSDMIYVGQKLAINGQSSGNTNQTAKPGTTTNTNASTHTVQRGDSLYQIALKYNVSVNDLKVVNGLTSDLIYVGQTLKIPGTTKVAKRQSTNKTKRHEVKSGDSLWSLSKEYNTSVSQIKSWNKLSSDVIYKGQNLRVG